MMRKNNKAENRKRKWRTGALIGALCLLLTACSSGEANLGMDENGGKNGNGVPAYLGQTEQEFKENVDLSTLSVQVSSGTAVTLYMNPEGTVLTAHCHDDRAIEICSDIQMGDMESVLFAFMAGMLAKGDLEDGDHLEIKIIEEEGAAALFPLYDVIDGTYRKIMEDSGLNLGMSVSAEIGNVGAVIRSEELENEQRPDQGGQQVVDQQKPDRGEQQEDDRPIPDQEEQQSIPSDDRFLEVERDEAGRLIRTLEEDNDGTRVERYYNQQGQCIRRITAGADGVYSEIDYQNEIPACEIIVNPDGVRRQITYREDGTRKECVITTPMGAVIVELYDEQERTVSSTETHSDGSEWIVIFGENGKRKTETMRDPIGNVIEIHYDDREKVVLEKGHECDGSIYEMTFDEKGNPVLRVTICADGTQEERRWSYDSKGQLTGEIQIWSDGSVSEFVYGGNGVIISEKSSFADGQTRDVTFNQKGEILSETVTFPDGTWNRTQMEYSQNGVRIREVQDDSRGQRSERIYDDSGMLVSTRETASNGNRIEIDYYANGNRKTMVMIDEDGRTDIWNYSEDGTWGESTGISGIRREYYDSSGRMVSYTFNAFASAGLDFSYEEGTVDGNGDLLTHKKVLNDGTVVETTFHYDKSSTTVYRYAGGGGHTEYWYGNNRLGGIDSDGNPWGSTVPGGDYSGLSYEGTIGKG